MTATLHPDCIRTSALDFWLARSAIAWVAGLQLLVVNDFSLGPPLTSRRSNSRCWCHSLPPRPGTKVGRGAPRQAHTGPRCAAIIA